MMCVLHRNCPMTVVASHKRGQSYEKREWLPCFGTSFQKGLLVSFVKWQNWNVVAKLCPYLICFSLSVLHTMRDLNYNGNQVMKENSLPYTHTSRAINHLTWTCTCISQSTNCSAQHWSLWRCLPFQLCGGREALNALLATENGLEANILAPVNLSQKPHLCERREVLVSCTFRYKQHSDQNENTLRAIRHLDQNENTSGPYEMSWHRVSWKALLKMYANKYTDTNVFLLHKLSASCYRRSLEWERMSYTRLTLKFHFSTKLFYLYHAARNLISQFVFHI
jgi:hypothetical protein